MKGLTCCGVLLPGQRFFRAKGCPCAGHPRPARKARSFFRQKRGRCPVRHLPLCRRSGQSKKAGVPTSFLTCALRCRALACCRQVRELHRAKRHTQVPGVSPCLRGATPRHLSERDLHHDVLRGREVRQLVRCVPGRQPGVDASSHPLVSKCSCLFFARCLSGRSPESSQVDGHFFECLRQCFSLALS